MGVVPPPLVRTGVRDKQGGGLIFTAGQDWIERQGGVGGLIFTAGQDWCERGGGVAVLSSPLVWTGVRDRHRSL